MRERAAALLRPGRCAAGRALRCRPGLHESHNGRQWASDNAPRGACFHVVLPTVVETRE